MLQRNKTYLSVNMGFGSFDDICRKTPLPLCSLVGPPSPIEGSRGIAPNCYARNVEVANTIIFQGAADCVHIAALSMIAIMILHVRSKFTAVGESTSCFELHVGREDQEC